MAAVPYRLTANGLVLSVRVTPNAGVDRIEGAEQRDDGVVVLRLRVAAVPDRGRANAAVVALLSKALGVSKSSIRLISGETARLKVLAVTGDPPALATRLAALL
jgi:uncharacterized protein